MADASRPNRPTFDEALAIIRTHVPPIGKERVGLLEALGRVTATEVHAASDYPRFDAAAMDGFGLATENSRAASPAHPVLLTLAGASRAGETVSTLAPETACRISTGAPIPAGCDCVLPSEEARVADERLVLDAPARAGRNVRRRGEDAQAGAEVLAPGTVITPAIVGALACYGVDTLAVTRRPAIVILPTGDELLAHPGAGSAAIFDANSGMITALLQTWGLDPSRAAPVGDDRNALERAIAEAATAAQIVVTTGGAAGGDHDHLAGALARLGATVHFHGVRMRPGKPLLFATLPDGTLFFGLPGNPVAALLGARFFLGAAVRAMVGLSPERGERVEVACDGKPGVTLFLKAVRSGQDEIAILEDQRSHTLRPLIAANCWVVADETAAGARRRAYPLT